MPDDAPYAVAPPPANRRVRAVIRSPDRRRALVLLNNRVIPGQLTVLLPGGGIEEGETPYEALQREFAEELGCRVELGPNNCRLLFSTTVAFDPKPGDEGGDPRVQLLFFLVDGFEGVPRNMEPESVVSVDWLQLEEVTRRVGADTSDWRIQIGALEALRRGLDPAKSGEVEVNGSMAREVERVDVPHKSHRVAPLPITQSA
jgi:8-oxo-dGTP pyrophosphatase MutT (NUDIX family)